MQLQRIIPATQTAIVQHEGGVLKATPGLPVQTVGPSDILVQVKVVGLNPCDFKMPLRFPTPDLWDGCDYAGTVVQVGDEVAKAGRFNVGDRVTGGVQGSNRADPTTGAYCEYLKVNSVFALHIPESMSFQDALGVSGSGISTLGIAFFWSLQIPGSLRQPASKPHDILIYGGEQHCRITGCGHRVITTCSPHNFDLVRSYGADLVFDYHLPSCAKDIAPPPKNSLRYVLDPFSEIKTLRLCHEAIGRMGGKYCALEQYQPDLCVRKTVKHELIMAGAISGKGVDLPEPYSVPPNPEIGEWASTWYPVVDKLVQTGKLRPVPVEEIQPGGFQGDSGGP
ncbi:Enoyl reductase [Penicillium chermesinum]|nr:Enoyl reductase [Penicillium chermesinum]